MGIDLESARRGLQSREEETRRGAVLRLDVPADDGEAAEALDFFVEAMGDSSWRVRKEAAARAAAWRDPELAAGVLASALAEPDNIGRRNAVVEALVGLGPHAVPALVAALDARPEHRKLIADALGLIGDLRGAQALAPLVDDSDANVRLAATEALGYIGGTAARAALGRALGRGELLLTQAAIEGLNRLGATLPRDSLEPLLGQPTLRPAALEALGRTGELAALEAIVPALTDGARSTREAAIRAAAELYRRLDAAGRERVAAEVAARMALMPHLVSALLDAALGVQRDAALLLGLTRRPEATRPLLHALADRELRENVLQAIAAIGPGAIETLVALGPELEGPLRGDVYAVLPRLGPAAAADARVGALLIEALDDESSEAAAAAAGALGEVGTREALGPLLHALGRDELVAQAAASALGRLGARHYDEVRVLVASRGMHDADAAHLCRVLGACGRAEDAPALRQALGADEAAVRRAAADALGQLPSSHEVESALRFALADEAPEVRAAVARALGAHRSRAAAEPLGRLALEGEPPVRAAAARALGQIALGHPAPEVQALLRAVADSADAVAAVPALDALADLDDPDDDSRFVHALAARDAEVVKAAARALGGRPRAGAVEALAGALADARWDVRRAVVQALDLHGARARLEAHRVHERDPLVLDAIEAALLGVPPPRDA